MASVINLVVRLLSAELLSTPYIIELEVNDLMSENKEIRGLFRGIYEDKYA